MPALALPTSSAWPAILLLSLRLISDTLVREPIAQQVAPVQCLWPGGDWASTSLAACEAQLSTLATCPATKEETGPSSEAVGALGTILGTVLTLLVQSCSQCRARTVVGRPVAVKDIPKLVLEEDADHTRHHADHGRRQRRRVAGVIT